MLYYAAITTPNGERVQGIFSPEEYFRATFSPDSVTHYITDLKPHSKQEARQIAINLLEADREIVGNGGECLGWAERSIIAEALTKAAHRFGLVREFQGNGII